MHSLGQLRISSLFIRYLNLRAPRVNLVTKFRYNNSYLKNTIRIGGYLSTKELKNRRYMSTSNSTEIVPVKVYFNADKDKELIINDNKGRTGIYR
jgi:hypothetical protein